MKVIILSGGSGTRLFPLSRENYPKQFLKIFGGESLFQKTLKRALKMVSSVDDIFVVTNKEYYFHVINDFKLFSPNIKETNIIQEPLKRNTAPAITLGIVFMVDKNLVDLKEPILILPSDHLIEPDERFKDYVHEASEISKSGYIVTFGIKPSRPETGYGYIELNSDIKVGVGYRVKRFHEKPSMDQAVQYVANQNFLWNSGIFCFTPEVFMEELKSNATDIYEIIHGRTFEEISQNFDSMPDISIDYAIMEKTSQAVVVPTEIIWSDVGSFEAIYDILPKDSEENAVSGNVYLIDSTGNLILSEKKVVCCLGVENLTVVATDDVITVTKRGHGQAIKNLVSVLKSNGEMRITEFHTTEYKRWGSVTVLDEGADFKIKRVRVNPNESLSLQMHYHRSEHWIVLKGTALVIMEDEDGRVKEKYVRENESIFIPKTFKHKLVNPGKIPLELIEVQVGEYVGEDDIVRFEDKYRRV